MTDPATARASASFTPLPALPAAVVGLFVTDFFPPIGTALGIVAALVALLVFFRPSGPRWLAWLLVGFVVGVVAVYALALSQSYGSAPASGSGESTATPVR